MTVLKMFLAALMLVFVSSAYAVDDPEEVNDRLVVIEIQLDALTEFLVSASNLIKICHVPPGNHMKSRVVVVPPEGVRAHLDHGGESFDYLLPGDSELRKGEWCDPYAGINQE